MTILGSMPAHFQTHTSWIFSQYLANSLLILFSTAVYHQKCQDTHLLHSLDVSNPLKWSMMHSNPPAMREIRQPVTFSHLSPSVLLARSSHPQRHRPSQSRCRCRRLASQQEKNTDFAWSFWPIGRVQAKWLFDVAWRFCNYSKTG